MSKKRPKNGTISSYQKIEFERFGNKILVRLVTCGHLQKGGEFESLEDAFSAAWSYVDDKQALHFKDKESDKPVGHQS